MIWDTHCHLDRRELDRDRKEVLERAWAAGVERIVIPGIGPDLWDGAFALAASEPRLSCAVGLHPQALPDLDPRDDARALERLEDRLREGRAIAVGECGLDAPAARASARGSMERQVRLLEAQLELARSYGLPVLLHVFRCQGEAVRVLERFGRLPAGGVLHSYSGGAELVKRWAKLGLCFSFAGPVTYERSVRVHEAARCVPRERLLLESDAPDQPPSGRRGERNEPGFLPEVLRALATVRGEDPEELAAATTLNARRLFGY